MRLQVFVDQKHESNRPSKIKLTKDYGPVFYETEDGLVSGKLKLAEGKEKYFITWAKRNGGFLLVRNSETEEDTDQGIVNLQKLKLKQ